MCDQRGHCHQPRTGGSPHGSSDGGAPVRGRRTVKTVPPPVRATPVTVPPWARVIDATMERPRPDPPKRHERRIGSEEPFEDQGDVLGAKARAVVFDADHRVSAPPDRR